MNFFDVGMEGWENSSKGRPKIDLIFLIIENVFLTSIGP